MAIPWTFLLKALGVGGLNGRRIANDGHNVGELEFKMGNTNSVHIWTQCSIMYSLYRQNDGAWESGVMRQSGVMSPIWFESCPGAERYSKRCYR